jgi:ABC-2 type transport system ATP-binding protein
MPDAAIESRGMSKVLGRRKVVDGIDLSVSKGEIFGFLGPNGAGKTTTIRLLLGLSRIDEGEAFILGRRVPAPTETLRHVGSMVEQPAFYPWMSGRKNLDVLLLGRCSKEEIESAMEEAGIAESARSKVRTYSQGMRQRLGLSLAICGRPQLLILDEPANGLDPAGIRDFRQLLRGLADRGCTVFLSSHQLSEVERACDRAAILHLGHVIAEGTVTGLGGDERWVTVSVDAQEERAALQALASMPTKLDGPGRILVKAESGHAVSRLLANQGVFPESVTQQSSTLEERFLSLTEGEGDGRSSR